ncbi:MAG: hypothetical protein ABIJ08_05900 [Nanoarchaeota archaeon]
MEIEIKERRRVNFSVSVKGIITPDITFESTIKNNEEVIKEAIALVELAQNYCNTKNSHI